MFRRMLNTRSLCIGAVIAALYVVLTMMLKPISFGENGFECRVSEALTLLPVLFPEAVPGLTVGCLISNLFSPVGPIDVIFGTLATLLACIMTYWTRNMRAGSWRLPLIPAIWPVLFNGLIVGGILTAAQVFPSYPLAFAIVAGGEAVAIVIGLAIFPAIEEITPRLRREVRG